MEDISVGIYSASLIRSLSTRVRWLHCKMSHTDHTSVPVFLVNIVLDIGFKNPVDRALFFMTALRINQGALPKDRKRVCECVVVVKVRQIQEEFAHPNDSECSFNAIFFQCAMKKTFDCTLGLGIDWNITYKYK